MHEIGWSVSAKGKQPLQQMKESYFSNIKKILLHFIFLFRSIYINELPEEGIIFFWNFLNGLCVFVCVWIEHEILMCKILEFWYV